MVVNPLAAGISLGIYEKALRGAPAGARGDWNAYFAQVPEAGFSFVDISIDESAARASRLEWSAKECRLVRSAAEAEGAMIGGICLSLHRRVGPGSADPHVRRRAAEIMARGLEVAHDLGVGVVQIAGYYCYYEEPHPDAEKYYAQMLADAVPLASRLGVTMGIENVDGTDVISITKAMQFVSDIDSPYLQVYPDLGNIAEQGFDPVTELTAGKGHMVAMHAKDVRRGEPRRVDMGTGIVDWATSFNVLADQRWSGRLMIEMWNDEAPDSRARCESAREFIAQRATEAGIPIVA